MRRMSGGGEEGRQGESPTGLPLSFTIYRISLGHSPVNFDGLFPCISAIISANRFRVPSSVVSLRISRTALLKLYATCLIIFPLWYIVSYQMRNVGIIAIHRNDSFILLDIRRRIRLL